MDDVHIHHDLIQQKFSGFEILCKTFLKCEYWAKSEILGKNIQNNIFEN